MSAEPLAAERPIVRMALEIVAGSEPIEGAVSLDRDRASGPTRWSFVGWVAFGRALDDAIGASLRGVHGGGEPAPSETPAREEDQ